MRKKSHVSLAMQICKSMDNQDVIKHPYVFCVGSILPDCVPSFLTTPHRKDVTFDKVLDKIGSFIYNYNEKTGCNYRRTLQLGQIIHYIADYFTFPHNNNYEGTLMEHCHYENNLKYELRRYIASGEAMEQVKNMHFYKNCEELKEYIDQMHEQYIQRNSDVYKDARYIVRVSMVVVASILFMSNAQLAV